MTLNITIDPAYIPYSEEKLGNLTLMEHQCEAKNSSEDLLILDAPTSSGKTLAMLSRFVETDGNCIFVYPTNELIKDQGKGIKGLLDKIGVSSTIIPMEENIDVGDNTDVIIAVVTGESLEGLAQTKGDVIRRIFHMVDDQRRMLMLTNIDTLLLLFKMQYKGGRRLLSEFLNLRYSVLAIDELHLYSGVAFANLFYLTWLLRSKFEQIIVSSATLQDSTKVFQEVYDDYKVISPQIQSEPDGAHQIRHETVLTLNPSNNILSRNDLDKLGENIASLFDPDSRATEVNTLTIVNSVVLSEELSDYTRKIYGDESVGVINGLIPSKLREQKPLTIGTSAVEVGVDFDVESLVFEGTNAGSFIQRLGRAGRHRPGKAIAYIPTGAYRKLNNFIEDGTRLTIGEIMGCSNESIPHLRSYINFSKSIYGAVLFTSILYKVEKESLAKYDANQIYKSIKRGWEELKPPFFTNSLQGVLKIAGKSGLEIISEGGARGDILSVPVFMDKYKIYSRMDVLDLSRTIFNYEDVKNIDAPKPPWMKSEKVAVVKGFRDRSLIKGDWGPLLNKNTDKILFTTTSGDDTTLSLYLDDENLEKQVNELLDRKIAYSTATNNLTDWRFPRIYDLKYRNKCLVIGLDALVQKYVDESNV